MCRQIVKYFFSLRFRIEFLQHQSDETNEVPLDKIQQQIKRMNSTIAELIELAKLESSPSVDYTNVVDIKTLLNDVYENALSLDQGKHQITLDLGSNISKDEPGSNLYGSYDELHMALSNLLTNSIRYTPDGGNINLFFFAHETGISIGVRDNGVGIDYAHIPRLTERFYRVDEGRSGEQGGTGLGLSIVKHVLDRHNAALYIQSTIGEGSTFRCDFPITYSVQ